MPTVSLNDRKVASLKAARDRVDYFDRAMPGFGLRVSPTGVKSWILMFRVNGHFKRLTLGQYPDLGLAKAREAARDELQKVSVNRDPSAERKQAKERTFSALCALYMERYAKRHKRSWKEDQRRITNVLQPAWGERPVVSLRRADLRELLDGIADRGAPVEANRTLALVRKILNFAIGQDWIEANPAAHLPRPGGADPTRDRVLTEDELRTLWKAWKALDPSMSAFYKLRLLTAQRGGEVASMRWSDVDLEAGWWTIPAGVTKNKLAHRVPLGPTAVKILKGLRAAAVAKAAKAKKGKVPEFVLAGARGKRQQAAAVATFGVRDFRGHDLRRTAASIMASGGISRLVISKVLNHVEPGVTAVYDRHGYDAEKQAALAWWDAKLTAILEKKAASVLPFARS